MKDVKCYIVNKDISIFEYVDYKFFVVSITGISKKRYEVGGFKTLEEAKNFINEIDRSE